ncbi:MAG: cold shock domain-containing protein [Pseudomonadota bacterium]
MGVIDQNVDGSLVSGRVKWFDAVRGFGFVVSPEVDRDVLLHVNVLRNFGQSSIVEGAQVKIRVQATGRGLQATEVLEVEADEEVGDDVAEYLRPVDQTLPHLPARVKWFDRAKGFGFANVFGSPLDVFIHIDVLRRFGLADLTTGEAVCLRVIDGARGKLAVEVRRWEFYVD